MSLLLALLVSCVLGAVGGALVRWSFSFRPFEPRWTCQTDCGATVESADSMCVQCWHLSEHESGNL